MNVLRQNLLKRLLTRGAGGWLALALLLAGCAGQTPPAGDAPLWREHERQLAALDHYQVRGSFAWLDGRQKLYAHFFWQQQAADSYRLLLTNPFGGRELDLRVTAGLAVLVDKSGKRYQDSDPARLLERLTGLRLPIDQLRLWLIGLPGASNDYRLDQAHRLKTLRYQQGGTGWQVTYSGYDSRQRPALPSGLSLEQGERRLKLKMDRWTIAPPAPAPLSESAPAPIKPTPAAGGSLP